MNSVFKMPKFLTGGQDGRPPTDEDDFKLADPSKTFAVLKVLLLVMTGILSFRFFSSMAAGFWGTVIGSMAVGLEVGGYVCWQAIPRTAGAYRMACIAIAICYIGTSILHAVMEAQKETGVAQQWDAAFRWYADKVAFSTLLIELAVGAFALMLTHWRTPIMFFRARSEQEIQKALLETEASKAINDAQLKQADSELAYFEQATARQLQMVDAIAKFNATRSQMKRQLSEVDDPELLKMIARSQGTFLQGLVDEAKVRLAELEQRGGHRPNPAPTMHVPTGWQPVNEMAKPGKP